VIFEIIPSSFFTSFHKIRSCSANEDAAKRYITASLKRKYASENGTELNSTLPKMSPLNPQYKTKKQSVFQKIAVFVLGAGFVTLPQMTGRRVGMPFVLSTPTLALRFRQNNGPTPSGDYQPSRSLSMAGSAIVD
jgi:hypothetical protein